MPKRPLPPFVERVLSYLETAESCEPDVWLRDDLRIAWITVLRAARGESEPFVSACYTVLRCHSARLSSKLEARRRALLGPLYGEFFDAALPPKKPVVSVRNAQWKKREAA